MTVTVTDCLIVTLGLCLIKLGLFLQPWSSMGLNARPVLNGLVVAEIARDLQELQQKAVSLVSSAWL